MDSRIEEAKVYLSHPMLREDDLEVGVIRGLVAYAEERLKVNTGLLSENTSLKQAARQGATVDLSTVPVLELLQEIQRRAGSD